MSTSNTRIFVSTDDRIVHCENNLVDLKLKDGTIYTSLEPRRLFPVSRADTYITLLDGEGVEIALIRSLDVLDADSREVIQASLADYYLIPEITRIISVSEKYGKLHWSVETDKGFKQFDIRNRNHDIKVFSDGCVRVRDSDDNRYIIPDYTALDRHSQALLVADM
ncbi:MAG: DUF1854 domain-containing protein [Clostridia bacterium]|nr:DUF1854 domain-containing protein [Clostridia bacterium]